MKHFYDGLRGNCGLNIQLADLYLYVCECLTLCLCMYVCMYVSMYLRAEDCVCVCIYVNLCVRLSSCMYACMCKCARVFVIKLSTQLTNTFLKVEMSKLSGKEPNNALDTSKENIRLSKTQNNELIIVSYFQGP